MNLKQKAEKYADEKESGWLYSYNGYINGFKGCKREILDFIKANPKASATQITDYLNSL